MQQQTDRQTRVTNIHFVSTTTHAKCNNLRRFSGDCAEMAQKRRSAAFNIYVCQCLTDSQSVNILIRRPFVVVYYLCKIWQQSVHSRSHKFWLKSNFNALYAYGRVP